MVVIELYSGCGRHGHIVSSHLMEHLWLPKGKSRLRSERGTSRTRAIVTLYSIDNNPDSKSSLKIDATGLTDSNLALIRSLIPHKLVVLLASPPCTAYSRANTTGVRDLEGADELVAVAKHVHYGLGVECTVVENPGTGQLMNRDVINDFLPHQALLDYCSHGSGYFRKPTCLWSGPKPFNLVENAFIPRLCQGQGLCPIMSYDLSSKAWVHPQWTSTRLNTRQSIPEQVSREVGIAICNYLNKIQ